MQDQPLPTQRRQSRQVSSSTVPVGSGHYPLLRETKGLPLGWGVFKHSKEKKICQLSTCSACFCSTLRNKANKRLERGWISRIKTNSIQPASKYFRCGWVVGAARAWIALELLETASPVPLQGSTEWGSLCVPVCTTLRPSCRQGGWSGTAAVPDGTWPVGGPCAGGGAGVCGRALEKQSTQSYLPACPSAQG